MSDTSVRTITLYSMDGVLAKTVPYTPILSGTTAFPSGQTGIDASFDITIVNNVYVAVLRGTPTGYTTGNTLIFKGSRFNASNSTLFKDDLHDAIITATSPNFQSFRLNGNPFVYWGDVKFEIPTVKNLVYADYVNSNNIYTPSSGVICQIPEFINDGITTGGLSYWRYLITDKQNDIPDHLVVSKLTPKSYNSLTVKFYDLKGQPITYFRGPWTMEIILYSKENTNEPCSISSR